MVFRRCPRCKDGIRYTDESMRSCPKCGTSMTAYADRIEGLKRQLFGKKKTIK